MTMTRDKIERMRADMQGVGDHCAWAFRVADLRPLLALAERALEPQGQALPELPEPFDRLVGHPAEGAPVFTADQMHAYARSYASQLALPAGPVPEGAVISRRLLLKAIQAINYHLEPESPEEYEQTMEELGALLDALPAVAQHSDDIAVDRFAAAMKEKLKLAREKGRGGWEQCDPVELSCMLREHVEKGDPRDVANFCMFLWSLGQPIGDTVLPISCYALPKSESPAVAQPVADERDDAMAPAHKKAVALLEKIRAANSRDAERYRFLRSLLGMPPEEVKRITDAMDVTKGEARDATPADFDKSVDAGMAARAAPCQPAEEGGKS